MNSGNILFICDVIKDLEDNWHSDSTIALMYSACKAGFNCYIAHEDDIYFSVDSLFFNAGKINFKSDPYMLKNYSLEESIAIESSNLECVFIRKEPPFNMKYVNVLSMLMLSKCAVINDPLGMIAFQEKFAPVFLNKFSPETLITKDYKKCLDFVARTGKVVLKALYSFQGRDVFLIDGCKDVNLGSAFHSLIKSYDAPIIIQKFVPEILGGDLRVIMINGEPEFCYSRIPVEGSFLSGTALFDSKVVSAELTESAKEICSSLSPHLRRNRLSFVAVDIIGDFLIEVNSTCPTGLQALRSLDGNIYADSVLFRFLEDL